METSLPDQPILGGATIYAKELPRVAQFYEEVCGLARVGGNHEFVVLQKEQLQTVIVQIPEHIAATIEIARPVKRREDSALKLVFVVQSISAARAAARPLGGVIDGEPLEWEFRGMRVCDGHDPEGNVIQVREHAL